MKVYGAEKVGTCKHSFHIINVVIIIIVFFLLQDNAFLG
ncbi:hypothetical protein SLEP1_g2468 [Rubroshorea leprosula]|uniref:Uncharacterized protein n=1 Tax=Rubroshorea leprosula TaxID=152421 RepID=A0AAV5HHR5_9ROSI|nr:hypothetical protein SLEP1_g2468 [Rubroshorea leprosula]